MNQQIEIRFRLVMLMVLGLLFASGCRSQQTRGKWFPPIPVESKKLDWFGEDNASGFAPYEHAYAMACEFQSSGRESCVDYYFQAATLAWPHIATRLTTSRRCGLRAEEIYRSSLEQLISTGQQFRRLHPVNGLKVVTAKGWMTVPVVYSGFPWQPVRFDYLEPVGTYSSKDLNKQYRSEGLGVAAVAINCKQKSDRFRREKRISSVTAILHPIDDPKTTHVLELADSLRVSQVQIGNNKVPLRRDLSAPFGFSLSEAERNYVESFIRPGSQTEDIGLFLIEPYQPDKIPVIFVHGLLSDPYTWVNLLNEIRTHPELVQKYQFWGFEYSTGSPFLASAAKLRQQLHELQGRIDPGRTNPLLGQTVLVGHSMGGLVAKLQVTKSRELVWQSVANRSFEDVLMTGTSQRELAKLFFFEPSPMVTRVVFMGTPHKGSPWAKRPIGLLGSRLVEEPVTEETTYKELLDANPGVFSKEFSRRFPTSIDMLRNDSPLLEAIDCLPFKPHVRQHSVIGCYKKMICAGDSDGIVPVASAEKSGVDSEKIVPAKHTQIHKSKEGIAEIIRILRLHLQSNSAQDEIPNSNRAPRTPGIPNQLIETPYNF